MISSAGACLLGGRGGGGGQGWGRGMSGGGGKGGGRAGVEGSPLPCNFPLFSKSMDLPLQDVYIVTVCRVFVLNTISNLSER